MPAEVIMPALGMAQETGKVLRWLKADGAAVAQGEPLLEVETDKVTVEIESPAEGTLAGVSAAEGAEVPVGTVIALVLADGEALSAAPASPSGPAESADGPPPVAPAEATVPHASAPQAHRGLASPKARRLAQAAGIELDAIAGSGPNGAVVAADVEAARGVPVAEVGAVWQRMAQRMTRAWQEAPQFVLTRDVDASALQAGRGDGVTITDLLVKHCAEALARHPRLTMSWRDGDLVPGPGVNVGIAVATDEALVVPVVHGADRLSLAEISARRHEIVAAARAGTLRPEDVQGGTFTISNLGMYGVDAFQAIVNAPQAAILAVGRIAERPTAVHGALTVKPVLTLTVTFDHRVVDGARGAEFLNTLAALVETRANVAEEVA
jgi:pyruvate dehydrogenase E2 component (dihydrolipoamide acetyltransferase)